MPYAELLCRTNFSFLQGASHPEELVERAAELGLHALAVTDRNGVYGMPKAYGAIKRHKHLKLITGAELTLRDHPRLTLLASHRKAYGLMCRMLTASHAGKPKGLAALEWSEFEEFMKRPEASGLFVVATELLEGKRREFHRTRYEELSAWLGDRLLLPLCRIKDGRDGARTLQAVELSRKLGCRIIATADVHYHLPERRRLHDTLTSTHHLSSLDEAGHKLRSNGEHYLKSPEQMSALFSDLPEAIANTLWVAEQCTFCPSELRYYYPSEWIPAGETAQSYLEKITREGAERRYPEGVPEDVRRQIQYELKLIGELKFADYFLTIWEIVQFARDKGILCQGRGSAANSIVCYCIGITSVDPVRMNLLFERFISVERGEPPDIDVDFEHERREEVIQYLYKKYGRDRAAMVSAVITYRSKSARRDVARALGMRQNTPEGAALSETLVEELKAFPRHLSIHSGGFTLSAEPIIEIVPVEPARMQGRTIIQWDKYDLDELGLLKVDVLSLGMLSALRKAMNMTGFKELADIPAEDPATYTMMKKGDTVGVFQIESRAQINMLGRLLPENFYDLVIEIAIVRPGPITGDMVHPYLKRRRGQEPIDYPHPALRDILGRTLGVPLFQEQVMKMAVALAGFSAGEADQLRRAIGAWRSAGTLEKMGTKLQSGLLASGLPAEFVERVFNQIKGFAEYGFPESHAASFALLAYASSYLKCHHPAEFTCALLNSQPMGFYSNYTLIEDARRHGVKILPVHPNLSDWDCTIEAPSTIRLGWQIVKGLGKETAEALIAERRRQPFASLGDFIARSRLRREVLHQIALGDAFVCFGLNQRHSLWELLRIRNESPTNTAQQLDLFSTTAAYTPHTSSGEKIFEPLDPYSEIRCDYQAYGLSTRGHPMLELRKQLPKRLAQVSSQSLRQLRHGAWAEVAGLVIVRQRPPTAGGTTFATLEDEHGFLDLILHGQTYKANQELFMRSFLAVRGQIQRDTNSVSLLIKSMRLAQSDTEDFHSRSFY